MRFLIAATFCFSALVQLSHAEEVAFHCSPSDVDSTYQDSDGQINKWKGSCARAVDLLDQWLKRTDDAKAHGKELDASDKLSDSLFYSGGFCKKIAMPPIFATADVKTANGETEAFAKKNMFPKPIFYLIPQPA